jgi:hypothetical protein
MSRVNHSKVIGFVWREGHLKARLLFIQADQRRTYRDGWVRSARRDLALFGRFWLCSALRSSFIRADQIAKEPP